MALDDVKMTYQTITNTHKFSMRRAQTAIFSRHCQGFVKVDPETFRKNWTLYYHHGFVQHPVPEMARAILLKNSIVGLTENDAASAALTISDNMS